MPGAGYDGDLSVCVAAEGERMEAKELWMPLARLKMPQQGLGNYSQQRTGASVVGC